MSNDPPTETSSEDYLDLEITNFNGASQEADKLHSYLRLGAEDTTVTHGNDLAEKITTFIDDTRERGGNDADPNVTGDGANIFHTLSQAQRQAETAKLTSRSKGGWRDHTDGNRVTTTRGDKVEVVRGNYKQLVLGREQWADDNGVGLNWESSGGITYHFDEVPGQIVDVRWEFDAGETKTWRVIEECDKGHVDTRYHGIDKDWVQGGDVVTRVGTLSAYDRATSSSGSSADDFEDDPHFDKPSDASHNASFNWPSSDTLPNVTEHVFARNVYDKCIADTVYEFYGSDDRRINKLSDEQCVHFLYEDHDFEVEYRCEMDGKEAVEVWLGPSYFEMFQEGAMTFKRNVFLDLRVGLMINELNPAGVMLEGNAGGLYIDIESSTYKRDFVAAVSITQIDASVARFEKECFVKAETGAMQWNIAAGPNSFS